MLPGAEECRMAHEDGAGPPFAGPPTAMYVEIRELPEQFGAESRDPAVAIQVRTVDSPGGFAALAGTWDALHAAARAASVFNSWLWQLEWWRAYGGGRRLRILVATRGGETLGILPLYVDQTRIA